MSFTSSLGYTPQFTISKDEDDITGQFADRLVALKISSIDGQGQGDRLQVSLDDRDWLIVTPANGGDQVVTLQVSLGYAQSGLYDQGTFAIDEVYVEGMPKTLRIGGSSNGFISQLKSPLIASYVGQTVNSVVNSIAQAAGLEAVVDPAIGSKVIEYLNQSSSSMHLMQSLERTYNGLAKYGDGKLSFTQRGTGQSASGVLAGGFELTPEDFAGWSYKIISRTLFSKVRASYWDKMEHALVWLTNTNKPVSESTAPFMIKKAFNSRDEAQSGADAMMDALNRGYVTGTITLAKGDPSIHGGAPFTVSGMKADSMDGSFLVRTATHSYTKAGGITTTLDFYTAGDLAFSASAIDASQVTVDGIDQANETPVTTPSGSSGIGAA